MPKKRKQLERTFCTELQKWMKHNLDFSYCWEAKVVDCRKDNRFFYNAKSTPKEIRNLQLACNQFIHKFSDISQWGTPFDGVTMKGVAGFFFIRFYRPRQVKRFYAIEVSRIAAEVAAGFKSMDEERASQLANYTGVLA